jgi:hypothetical protein
MPESLSLLVLIDIYLDVYLDQLVVIQNYYCML